MEKDDKIRLIININTWHEEPGTEPRHLRQKAKGEHHFRFSDAEIKHINENVIEIMARSESIDLSMTISGTK